MTLIMAINCKDGLVVASDSQATKGDVKEMEVKKIHKLSDNVLFAAAGSVSAINDLREILSRFKSELSGELSIDTRQMIRSEIGDWLKAEKRLYYDAQSFKHDGKEMGPMDPSGRPQPVPNHLSVGLILAVQRLGGDRKIWHVYPSHAMQITVDDYSMDGNGAQFAETLIHKYNNDYYKLKDLDSIKVAKIAYKIIKDTENTSSFGVGGPIDIWIMNEHGIKQLSRAEISEIDQNVRQLEKDEAKLLVDGISLQGIRTDVPVKWEKKEDVGSSGSASTEKEHNDNLDKMLRNRVTPPKKRTKTPSA